MINAYYQHHARELTRIVKATPPGAPALLRHFIEAFYAKVHTSDLEQLDARHAVSLAASAFRFFESRKKPGPQIRIFTPTVKEHGYESRSVVVELINDDMPFLVDSLSAELSRQGFTIRDTLHPVFYVSRDKSGKLAQLSGTCDSKALKAESLIHFEISGLPEDISPAQLQTDLEWVLEYISCAVNDWQPIEAKALEHVQSIAEIRHIFDAESIAEAQDFMRWLISRNFIFLGYAQYDFFDARGKEKFSAVQGSKLGILRIGGDATFRGLESLPPELRHLVLVPTLLEITKTMRRSPVHRPVPMDCIGIKRFNAKGEVIGEARFLGLFTSNVYYQSSEHIPVLRHKIARALERADFDPAGHDGKALKAILEFLPRDEVFQMSEDNLLETSLGILALEAKPACASSCVPTPSNASYPPWCMSRANASPPTCATRFRISWKKPSTAPPVRFPPRSPKRRSRACTSSLKPSRATFRM